MKYMIRKLSILKYTAIIFISSFILIGCSDDNNQKLEMEPMTDFIGTYTQDDQKGRPAINTVFVSSFLTILLIIPNILLLYILYNF